ncbi:MAG: hypothetical protein QW667_03375 [Candidatus Bathyarchaeia archaeon]
MFDVISLDDVDRKIILAVGDGEVSVSEMIKKAGLSRQSAYTHLEKLIGLKLILQRRGGFPRTRMLRLSEEGLKVYEELRRAASAGQTGSAGLDVFRTLLRERCKTLKYMAPLLEESFAKAYAQYLAASATLGFIIPMSKEILQKIEGYAESLVEGMDIAIYPKPQSATEEEAVGKAALELLERLFKDKEFRERVAQTGKLTFILSLDLSKINEPAQVKGQILFWALVYEGLHKEGKI